jgi:hypothetical protein
MSNEISEEKKYYQKLGIVPTSIENVKKIIKTNIKNTIQCWSNGKYVEKQTFRVVSPAGIGKTQSALQICEELSSELNINFQSIIIKAPVLSRDDLLCPFPIIDNGKSRFKMLYSDFIPLDPDSYGLFIIDEISRGDTSFQQLCWQIQNEQKVHTYPLPNGWFVLCLDNPDDSEYGGMNYTEDAAGLRRVLHLYSEVNAEAFLKYAVKSNFHPLVVEFIQIHPDYLYDFSSQKIGMVYANPGSWERASNILWGYETDSEFGILQNLDDLTTLFGGLLNQNMTRMFISFIRDRKDISPKDVFYDYKKVRKDILEFAEKSDNIKMGQLIESFVTFLATSKPNYSDKELENISNFLTDIPSDIGVLFITKLSVFDIKSEEFKYVTKIHGLLVEKFPDYKTKFYESMVRTNRKVNAS